MAERTPNRRPFSLQRWRRRRVKTPTVLQIEAVECGAAALAIVMSHFGRIVTLEELRVACGVSRDGSKAYNLLRAAEKYGFVTRGFKAEIEDVRHAEFPVIIFWNFNHFVVLEGVGRDRVYLNDPATGPRTVTAQEFDEGFTGIVLSVKPGPSFTRGGERPTLLGALRPRVVRSKPALLFAVLTGLGLVVPGLAIPTFAKVFVDDVMIGQMRSWLGPLMIGMGLTAALRAALTWLQQQALQRLELKIAIESSSRFLWHVLRLPMEFFAQRWPGEIGMRVQINDKVAQLLSGELATTIVSVVTVVFYAAVMLAYDAVLTAIGVGFAIVNVAVLRYVARKRVDENQRLQNSRGQLMGAAAGGLQMMENLKATGTESEFFMSWAGYYAKAMNAEQHLGRLTVYLSVVPPLLTTLNTAMILLIGGHRVMGGHMSVGDLVAFQTLMLSFMTPINQLVTLAGSLQEIQADMNRLDDVLKYEVDRIFSEAPDGHAAANVVKLSGRLELRNVTFGYSRLEPPLIENFNLTINPGERVALVGGSGSGKSTISRLVAGLYDPWAGEILFDGERRANHPPAVLRASLGFVDQDIFLFGGSVKDNLSMWDPTLPETSMVQAARDAQIHDDVVVRPDGYDSTVEEAGANFSGGQRQRLEIARALAESPTLLVLDEATSALDAGTEKVIDDHLRRRGCSCLIVAHRLSTIRDSDQILVLDCGQVVQRGTHDELKTVEGPYAALIES